MNGYKMTADAYREFKKKDPKEHDRAYKYLFAMDGVPFASKDLKTAEIAVSILVNGEQRNPTDFIKDLEEGEK